MGRELLDTDNVEKILLMNLAVRKATKCKKSLFVYCVFKKTEWIIHIPISCLYVIGDDPVD